MEDMMNISTIFKLTAFLPVFCAFQLFSMLNELQLKNLEGQLRGNRPVLQNKSFQELENILSSIAIARIQKNNDNLFGHLYESADRQISTETSLYDLEKKLRRGEANLSEKSNVELQKIIEEIERKKLRKPLWLLYENAAVALENMILSEQQNEIALQQDPSFANQSSPRLRPTGASAGRQDDRDMEEEAITSFDIQSISENITVSPVSTSRHSIKISLDVQGNITKDRLLELSKAIVTKPADVIKSNKKLNKHIASLKEKVKEIQQLPKSIRSTIESLIKNAKLKKYPEICFLYECACNAAMDRTKTGVKKSFEDRLCENVNMDEIIYVGFGPGGLFPDLRILVKLLESGKKIKAIHLIDSAYMILINLMTIYYDRYRENMSLKHIHEIFSGYVDYRRLKAFEKIAQLAQFMNLLAQLTNKKIEIYLHTNVYDYFKSRRIGATERNYPESHPLEANVGTAIDFTQGFGYYGDYIEDMRRLEFCGLQMGGLWGRLSTKGEAKIQRTTANQPEDRMYTQRRRYFGH